MKISLKTVVFVGLMSLLSGCAIGKTYFISKPTGSATLVQSWTFAEFVRLIREHQDAVDKISVAPANTEKVVLLPLFDVPFEITDLANLTSHARDGDLVLWYSDHWADLKIEYICLQRGGKIVWMKKRVGAEPETVATLRGSSGEKVVCSIQPNQSLEPMARCVTPRARHESRRLSPWLTI